MHRLQQTGADFRSKTPIVKRASGAQAAAPQPSKVPAAVQEPAVDRSIRNHDFVALTETKFARPLGGGDKVREACAELGRTEPVEIFETVFGDLDGDGREEAAVSAISCQAGSAGPDLFAVFKLSGSGEISELNFEQRKWNEPFKGKDPSAALRSAPRISIEDGRLVKSYGIFKEKDAGCCATGGTRKFLYRWDGHQFALDDIIDLPPEKAGN
jgi:hypothetical protein